MTGVLTVAIGNVCYYQYAANLIASIRKHMDMPVCVLHDGQHTKLLNADYLIKIPKHLSKNPFFFKTKLYDYTPFEKTIYIDADSLIMKPFEIPQEHYMQGYSTYPNDVDENRLYTWWGEAEQIAKHNKVDYLPQTYSGFMVFNRKEHNFFKQAEKIYKDKTQPFKEWRGDIMPDEYAFNVAWAKTYAEPPKQGNYVFLASTGGKLTYPQMFNDFSIVTCNGGDNSYSKHLYYQNAFINEYPYQDIKKDAAILELSKQ